MAITPNDKPNQFMFTALPFEGMINQAAQEKRMKDAYEMQMAGQLGKFQGQLMAQDHLLKDSDIYKELLNRSGDRLDELMKKHPDGFYSADATKDFYTYTSRELNDPDYRTLAYNYKAVDEDKKAIKENDKLDDISKKHALAEVAKFETTRNELGDLSVYSPQYVPDAYDRDKAILQAAEKVPAIKTYRKQLESISDDKERERYIKEEILTDERIRDKALPWILRDPAIQKVKAYRVQNGLQTENEFDMEILGHVLGAANLLSYEINAPQGGGKTIKKPEPHKVLEGVVNSVQNYVVKSTRDVADLSGTSRKELEDNNYNFDAIIENKKNAIDSLPVESHYKTLKLLDERIETAEAVLEDAKINAGTDVNAFTADPAVESAIKNLESLKQERSNLQGRQFSATEKAAEKHAKIAMRKDILELENFKMIQNDLYNEKLARSKTYTDVRDGINALGVSVKDGTKLTNAIYKASLAVKDDSDAWDYTEGNVAHSQKAIKFGEVLAKELGITDQNYISKFSLAVGRANNGLYGKANLLSEIALETRKEVTNNLLDRYGSTAIGEDMWMFKDKKTKDLMGATAYEQGVFNAEYINAFDVQGISESTNLAKIKGEGAKIELIGQSKSPIITNSSDGNFERRNFLKITERNGKETIVTAKMHPDFKESANALYNNHVREVLQERGLIKENEEINSEVIAQVQALQGAAVPKTDNVWRVNHPDGTEDVYKLRAIKNNDTGEYTYVPFLKSKDDKGNVVYKSIETRFKNPANPEETIPVQLNFNNIDDAAIVIGNTVGARMERVSSHIKLFNTSQQNITNLAFKHEGGPRGYNSILNSQFDAINSELGGKPVTEATVNELDRVAKKVGKGNTAMGAYQMTKETRDHFFASSGTKFTKDDKFNKAMQDEMLAWLINSPEKGNYLGYKKGKISKEKLINNLSKVWAAFPKDSSGKSYYEGKYGNKAQIPYNEILKAIVD